MALNPIENRLSPLGRCLVTERALTAEQVLRAEQAAQREERPLVDFIAERGVLGATDLAKAVSRGFHLPLLDLNAVELANCPRVITPKLVRQHSALPLFQKGNQLYVGMADPSNVQGLDELQFHTGLRIQPVVVEHNKLSVYIDKYFGSLDSSMADLIEKDTEQQASGAVRSTIAATPESTAGLAEVENEEDAPIIRFVNKMLVDAFARHASDIHLEPYERSYRVRFRMDGVLHEIVSPPTNWSERLAARIKVMARLDVAERRVPQDGAIKVRISSTRELDLRISTLPTMFGEKIVIRLLDSTPAMLDIDHLGYEPHQRELYLEALRKPQGMILVTGPTGSGKTVSLYTGLRILNKPEVNIATAEDPCEIKLPGINQVSIHAKVGLTFAAALRAFLRQDPDIIMVGEIRDLETAEIAMKAAQTGHLVLSTLHTNDASHTITRLLNIGVEPFNIADTVDLIIAQRLVRCLCNNCKMPHDIPEHALLKSGFSEDELRQGLQIFQANKGGCEQCAGGFKGRTGIYQVLPISEEISRLIMQGGNSMDIATQAKREGVSDLRRSGLNKVREGITSLHEIYRVTVN